MTNQTGVDAVMVRSFPGAGAVTRVSLADGGSPRWSPDGRTLYYRTGPALLAVQFDPLTGRVGGRRELFEAQDLARSIYNADYDVHPRTGEFLMVELRNPPPSRIEVLIGWTAK